MSGENLVRHLFGIRPPDTSNWPTCSKCGDRWKVLETETLCRRCVPVTKAEPLAPTVLRSWELIKAGVPVRYREEFIEPKRWPKAVGRGEGINDWRGNPEALTLIGGTDTGKTMLAVELLWRLPGRSKRWVVGGRIPELVIKRDAFEELTSVDVLLIDELGRGHNRDAWEYVFLVVKERWDERRPTLFTTNLAVTANEESNIGLQDVHPALFRRMREGLWVPLKEAWRSRL